MSKHNEYDLKFTKTVEPGWGIYISCNYIYNTVVPPIQGQLKNFLSRSKHKAISVNGADYLLREINKIINGTWQGIDGEDNIYYEDPNIVIKLSLTDGFAYFAEIGDYPVQPKIVLTDLKEIIEEWIEFRYTSYKVS